MENSPWSNQLLFTSSPDAPAEKRRKLDKQSSKNLHAVGLLTSQKCILDDIAVNKATSNIQLKIQSNRPQILTNSGKILDI